MTSSLKHRAFITGCSRSLILTLSLTAHTKFQGECHVHSKLSKRPIFNLSDVFTKEEVALTSKREELLLLSDVPSLGVEVGRSKIIKTLQQTFSF